MFEIKFEYRDEMSKGEWRKQCCVMPSIAEFRKVYGLGVDCEYRIISAIEMPSHCGIAIKTKKGYESIYVNSNGYPDYMWPMLTENYNSEELVTKLIRLGNASFIDKKLEPTGMHFFGSPEPGVCVFYCRDRRESWSKCLPTIYNFKEEMFNSFYYSYIWEDGCWNFYEGGKKVY